MTSINSSSDVPKELTSLSSIEKKPVVSRTSRSRGRILAAINRAAIEVFAQEGLSGASTKEIAERAGLSKQQLHYYIDSKEALYRQILQDVIDDWITVFGFSDEALGPKRVLSDYIRKKLIFSFVHPLRSKIFSMEMMRGGPILRPMMTQSKSRTGQASTVIQNWINQGMMAEVEPLTLLFTIWSITQFYADQAEQVSYFTSNDSSKNDQSFQEKIITQTTEFILRGVGI